MIRCTEPDRLDYCDALRGLAILGVIAVHSREAVRPLSPWLDAGMAAGARGVQLFFVVSAVTLSWSWSRRNQVRAPAFADFYVRRLFRIAPAFLIAVLGYVALHGLGPRYFAPNGIGWGTIGLTMLFLNGLHPETITSVVPGGWSIAAEMLFYAIFPFVATRVRSVTAGIGFVVLAWAAGRVAGRAALDFYLPHYPADQSYLVYSFRFFSIFSQLSVFAMGVLAHRVLQSLAMARRVAMGGAIVSATWLTSVGITGAAGRYIELSGVFACIVLVLAFWPVNAVVNRVTTYLGTISFSMYLSHFVVIDALVTLGLPARLGGGDLSSLLFFLLAVIITAAVSTATYRLIERPGIEAGRRILSNTPGGAAVLTRTVM